MPTSESRHPSTTNLLRWFDAGHLPSGPIRDMSLKVGALARTVADDLPDSPELGAGLRHLLEAKDCFVRATIDVAKPGENPKDAFAPLHRDTV